MKFTASLIVVKDMQASRRFYTGLLEQPVVMDLGANVVVGPGVALQTADTWAGFIDKKEEDIRYGGQNAELVFETEDLDAFLEKLKGWPEVEMVNEVKEFPWGQRVAHLYDPDRHVVEVGEDMVMVVKRFLMKGMSPEQAAQRTMFPLPFVEQCKKQLEAEGKQ